MRRPRTRMKRRRAPPRAGPTFPGRMVAREMPRASPATTRMREARTCANSGMRSATSRMRRFTASVMLGRTGTRSRPYSPPLRRSRRSRRRRLRGGAGRAGLEARLLRMAPVEEQGPPEDLGHLRSRAVREPPGRLEAVLGALAPDLHLDELVVEQRPRELPEHGLAHAFLPDLHDGGQVVPGGAELPPQRAARHERALLRVRGCRHGFTFAGT